MRPTIRLNFIAVLILAALCPWPPAHAGETRFRNFTVRDAWSRPTPPGATVGVVYFTMINTGHSADALVALSSPIAGKVELHETRTAGGVMEMREVAAVDLPPGAAVKSEPGGLHVMLIGLTRPLIAGDTFAISLQFREAGVVTLRVPVENRE